MAYFECVIGGGGTSLTIQITTSSTVLYGQTITISKGGSTVGTTAFDNTGNAEYTVRESGTYTVSVVYSGTTFSNTVEVTDTFDAEIYATPDGSTVTPVNDIQTWLHCGNVWDKNYTTISQVLSDTTTLLALINSNNAVDYMVRSHDWCTDVCADATAMTYIGANNYAADTLLADSGTGNWRESICNSAYFESVLNVKVPTMTSDTTPSGEAFLGGPLNTGYHAFRVFDGNNSTEVTGNGTAGSAYVGYDFGAPCKIYKVSILLGNYYARYTDFKIQGSNDGFVSDIHDLSSAQTISQNTFYTFDLASTGPYRYYRVIGNSSGACVIYTLQFYGRAAS